MAIDLLDRVVIITGASSGIGRATAHAFGRRCARLVLASRNEAKLMAAREEVERLGAEAIHVRADVTRNDDVQRLVDTALSRFGRIDVLVNNAGVGLYAPVAELTPEAMDPVMQVNVYGALRTIRAVVPHMRRLGGGIIVNVSSVVGQLALPLLGGYSATKSALEALSAALRLELRPDAIDVVLVRPGVTDTAFVANTRAPTGMELRRPPTRAYSAEQVASGIVRATEQGVPEVVLSPEGRVIVGLAKLAPRLAEQLSLRWVPTPLRSAPSPVTPLKRAGLSTPAAPEPRRGRGINSA